MFWFPSLFVTRTWLWMGCHIFNSKLSRKLLIILVKRQHMIYQTYHNMLSKLAWFCSTRIWSLVNTWLSEFKWYSPPTESNAAMGFERHEVIRVSTKMAKHIKNMLTRIRLPVKRACLVCNLGLVSCLLLLSRKCLSTLLKRLYESGHRTTLVTLCSPTYS